ncbi:hypothetical protein GQ42DRAFT_82287 [Ramicandelaber brevisporus]|nr:hypothetical protein GQ42DRAFT_82287 [Ramicandelaber brevisporus]
MNESRQEPALIAAKLSEEDAANEATSADHVEQASAPSTVPLPKLEFVTATPAVTVRDMELLRLTAQYVALHGPSFAQQLLLQTHHSDPSATMQFDFLRAGHSLLPTFEELVAQYQSILRNNPATTSTLLRDEAAAGLPSVYERVKRRATGMEENEARRRQARKDRVEAMTSQRRDPVDWRHGFVVVASVEFTAADDEKESDIQVPINKDDIARLSIAERRRIAEGGNIDQDDTMKIAQTEASSTQTASTASAGLMMKCPQCQQLIPADELNEHLRIELRDHRYKMQHEQQEQRYAERDSSVNMDGEAALRILQSTVQRRSDVFNQGDQSTQQPQSKPQSHQYQQRGGYQGRKRGRHF